MEKGVPSARGLMSAAVLLGALCGSIAAYSGREPVRTCNDQKCAPDRSCTGTSTELHCMASPGAPGEPGIPPGPPVCVVVPCNME